MPPQGRIVNAEPLDKSQPIVVSLKTGVSVYSEFKGSSGPLSPRVFNSSGVKVRDDVSVHTSFHGSGLNIDFKRAEEYRVEFESPGFGTAVLTFRAVEGLKLPVVFKALKK